MTKDEAMKLALEALENHSGNYKLSKFECVTHNAAIDALREALAEQPAQQEPVAWLDDDGNLHREKPPYEYGPNPRPLVFGYTSPPAQRTPLTVVEIMREWNRANNSVVDFARAIEVAHDTKENT